MTYELQTTIRTESLQGMIVITLDGQSSRNALDFSTWQRLDEALATAEADDEVRAVVLTGAGRTFSSGADLRTTSTRGRGGGARSARLRLAHQVIAHIRGLKVPIVAAAEGATVGIALGILLACDLIVASSDAHFSAPFLARGLIPDGGVGWMLPRLIGRSRATSILLLGDRVSAAEALRQGLVHDVVEPGGVLDAATTVARRLATGPPEATRLARELIRRSSDLSFLGYLDEELLVSALQHMTGEPAEGRAAFFERRMPSFVSGAAAADGADTDATNSIREG